MLTNNSETFGTVSRALHWLMALLIVALVVVGLYMTGLDREDPARAGIYGLHKSVGVLVLVLAVVRIAWLRLSPAPALPGVLNLWERTLTRMVAGLLYATMLGLPIVGWIGSNAAGHPVGFFGLFELPNLVSANPSVAKAALGLHSFVAYCLVILVGLHLAGALKHRYLDKAPEADVLGRMMWVPGQGREPAASDSKPA